LSVEEIAAKAKLREVPTAPPPQHESEHSHQLTNGNRLANDLLIAVDKELTIRINSKTVTLGDDSLYQKIRKIHDILIADGNGRMCTAR
jgi:hypothetical protein